MTEQSLTIHITATDLFVGQADEPLECPVALALQRATGDTAANVYEHDFELCLEAHGRSMVAPDDLRQYIREIGDGGAVEPLDYLLPPVADWLERCRSCHRLCRDDELTEDGDCIECCE